MTNETTALKHYCSGCGTELLSSWVSIGGKSYCGICGTGGIIELKAENARLKAWLKEALDGWESFYHETRRQLRLPRETPIDNRFNEIRKEAGLAE